MTERSEEVTTMQEYLERLKEELAGSDPALVQDALYDAEEYLRNAVGGVADGASEPDRQAALASAVERFGTPREVAEAYHRDDLRVASALAQPAPPAATDPARRILGVFLDPRAYGALLFMFLSLATGILYFTWAVTGLSLSAGLSILIVGLPFMLLFLASIRMFSLLEGRLVESLLGVRMPRRPRFAAQGSIWARLRTWLADRRTWTTLLYMVLKLPMGIFSFVLFTVLMSISLALLAAPITQLFLDQPLINLYRDHYLYVPLWAFPLFWLAGLLDLLLVMHLARALGRAYGGIAKAMLVSA
ncbi:MAG TPA: sensor domain-containing protein [Thermoanaerobaculia bacterium]|nr:sensor domain-containing protein [Thermoanaerobaculia bacterium]